MLTTTPPDYIEMHERISKLTLAVIYEAAAGVSDRTQIADTCASLVALRLIVLPYCLLGGVCLCAQCMYSVCGNHLVC